MLGRLREVGTEVGEPHVADGYETVGPVHQPGTDFRELLVAKSNSGDTGGEGVGCRAQETDQIGAPSMLKQTTPFCKTRSQRKGEKRDHTLSIPRNQRHNKNQS